MLARSSTASAFSQTDSHIGKEFFRIEKPLNETESLAHGLKWFERKTVPGLITILIKDINDSGRINGDALLEAFSKKELKISTLFNRSIVWLIITFKNDKLALEYGKKHNLPYSIHAFFEKSKEKHFLLDMEMFAPMVNPFDELYQGTSQEEDSAKKHVRVYLRKMKDSFGNQLIFIGTPGMGLDKSYLTDEPRKGIDPKIPVVLQAARYLSKDRDSGKYDLHNYMSPKSSYLSCKNKCVDFRFPRSSIKDVLAIEGFCEEEADTIICFFEHLYENCKFGFLHESIDEIFDIHGMRFDLDYDPEFSPDGKQHSIVRFLEFCDFLEKSSTPEFQVFFAPMTDNFADTTPLPSLRALRVLLKHHGVENIEEAIDTFMNIIQPFDGNIDARKLEDFLCGVCNIFTVGLSDWDSTGLSDEEVKLCFEAFDYASKMIKTVCNSETDYDDDIHHFRD